MYLVFKAVLDVTNMFGLFFHAVPPVQRCGFEANIGVNHTKHIEPCAALVRFTLHQQSNIPANISRICLEKCQMVSKGIKSGFGSGDDCINIEKRWLREGLIGIGRPLSNISCCFEAFRTHAGPLERRRIVEVGALKCEIEHSKEKLHEAGLGLK